jgi:hypothetical protein
VQTILAGHSTWVALVVMVVLLAFASMQWVGLVWKDEAAVKNAFQDFERSLVAKKTEVEVSLGGNPRELLKAAQQEPATSAATPAAASEKSRGDTRIPSASPAVINLLSPENGGHIIVADTEAWSDTIDGKEDNFGIMREWAVYGFKNEGLAKFDTFKAWIPSTNIENFKEFELLAGNDSPTGKFELIGKFQTQNFRFFKDPWQEFKFRGVTARYLKVKVISNYGGGRTVGWEFQLLGVLGK